MHYYANFILDRARSCRLGAGPIVVTMLLACGGAQAADWISIGKSDSGGIEEFLDTSSMVISAGDIRRAWVKVVYGHHKEYTLEQDAFDCRRQVMRGESYTIYSEDGTHEDRLAESFPEHWRSVTPETISSTLMQFVCASAPG